MSPAPWFDVLDRLLAEKGWTQEDLAGEMRRRPGPMFSASRASKIKSGARPLRPAFLKAIAGALDVPPTVFSEYLLALWRAQLDEKVVGLDRAVENLTQLTGAEANADGLPDWEQMSELLDAEEAPRGRGSPGRKRRDARGDDG